MNNSFKNIKKLGLAVVCFDATELLYGILSEIRDLVDYILVGTQEVSYNGDKMSATDLYELHRLQGEGLIDEIKCFNLDSNKPPREQECDKRNMMIDQCKAMGCTHALVIDSDEFYKHDSFLKALRIIDDNDYQITYCRYINYWHDFTHYLVYPFEKMYVPFVTRVEYKYEFNSYDFMEPSDPTRRYARPYDSVEKIQIGPNEFFDNKHYTVDYYEFKWNELKMHHLSWVRANIRKKLNNWSSKTLFENTEDLIDKSVDRYNSFTDERMEDDAILMFNTPGNKVEIAKYDKQYISFNYDFNKRLIPQQEDKKILILILSCNNPDFLKLENTIRETYIKTFIPKFKNIQYYFYRGTTEETHIEGDVLYVKNADKFETTASKFHDAVLYLKQQGVEYDYLYRSNSSSYVNIPLLNKFVGYLDNDENLYVGNIYCAFWSKFNFYGGGESMLFTKRNVDIFLNLYRKYDGDKLEKIFESADDNLIYGLFNARNLYDLQCDATKMIHSYGIYRIMSKDFNVDEEMFRYIATQVKDFYDDKRDFDSEVEKLKKIDEIFKDKNFSDEDVEKQYRKLLSHLDEECYLLDMQKKDYFNWKNSKHITAKEFVDFRFGNKMTREELRQKVKNPPYNVLNVK